MPLMTKKKKDDRHGSGFMVRLPEVYRTQLRKLRAINRRPMTAEMQIALEEYLKKFNLWPPAEEEEQTD
jgi:hypothetical protein